MRVSAVGRLILGRRGGDVGRSIRRCLHGGPGSATGDGHGAIAVEAGARERTRRKPRGRSQSVRRKTRRRRRPRARGGRPDGCERRTRECSARGESIPACACRSASVRAGRRRFAGEGELRSGITRALPNSRARQTSTRCSRAPIVMGRRDELPLNQRIHQPGDLRRSRTQPSRSITRYLASWMSLIKHLRPTDWPF